MTPAAHDDRAPGPSGRPRQDLLDAAALERLAHLRERCWVN